MTKASTAQYRLNEDGAFVIESYNYAKPFASFFPGIAGPHGIPMWAFYVNRGQCVCSMGLDGKEAPIMEFLSANRAYQITSNQGFRTYVKITRGRETEYYEPFQQRLVDIGMKRKQQMIIRPAQLTLVEENTTLGLTFKVDYFNVPEDTYAGMVRVLSIENTGAGDAAVDVLDGLPIIVPFGVDNGNLKHMRRLVESFVEVVNYRKNAPFFKGKVKQEDRPEVIKIKQGHFYIGFTKDSRGGQRVPTVVDPMAIYGALTDYAYPEQFMQQTPYRIPNDQRFENCLPCAFGQYSATVKKGDTHTYYSVIGQSNSVKDLNKLLPRISKPEYILDRQVRNGRVVDEITQCNFTCSRHPEFDMYCRQNFLDNVLRGGLPITFEGNGQRNTVHLYSRKHGDLERDYNDYRLSPTNYSQGNGNFRDINQNRRSDLLVNPDVRESNVEHFYNLIQLDGYNPLGVKTTSFSVRERKGFNALLKKAFAPTNADKVKTLLEDRFTPGELFSALQAENIKVKMDPDTFLGELLSVCDRHQETDYGHCYWSDHWTYNLDLLENYLAVYPENLRGILLDNRNFTFFDNTHVVRPRSEKYVLWEGNPMQLDAVYVDDEKARSIAARKGSPYEVRTQFGKGDIYRTTLINKMICLAVNKLASLDPAGVGVEMEADKPNWYDALNGLPGLMGSSISETLEIKRLIRFMLGAFDELELKDSEHWPLAVEIKGFMDKLNKALRRHLKHRGKEADFKFWNEACDIKEAYRAETRMGLSGKETDIRLGDLREFLQTALEKIDRGVRKAWDSKRNVLYTYFRTEVAEYKLLTEKRAGGKRRQKVNARGMPCFRPVRIKHTALPLFLEGPVHFLRIEQNPEKARQLVQGIKRSGLYDRKLKMYKVNENLTSQPMEIGRTRTFSRGWLENESIWMHMEYKYMLELLRSGLVPEFYQAFKQVLVPFMDPAVYGRSILENSSFIASSANPDNNIHGNGFVARLSGSTAEFVHILILMTSGQKPFSVNAAGELELQFNPTLPKWLFTTHKREEKLWVDGRETTVAFPANSFSFTFLGDIQVTYHNPGRKNTYGQKAARPHSVKLMDDRRGKTIEVEGATITGPLAAMVREGQFNRIEILLK